ncbi:Pls/PosA family non-ribosomal peptide synthetase [Pseudonocardia sp. CA-142604]|uniref:Pls/PosA family non-ribosomal peptide synthetase n=1 Tax=Pseudonocardia sp. CA-142604 TaxID=3240024 RepID=UPI003D8D0643
MSTLLQEPGPLPAPRPPGLVLVAAGHAQGPRTHSGERLNHVFEDQVDRMRSSGIVDQLAVDAGEITLTFAELDERANRLARFLIAQGAGPGDRIALLFDQAVHSYIGMLAVLKINAAYVPLDVGFPSDRIAYIISDAGARMVLSLAHVRDRVDGLDDFAPGLVYVDQAENAIAQQSPARLSDAERGEPVEDLAYLIYTSGTTGRPKGVAIEHASICNFVRVAAEVYGISAQDRVYQGMTIAFDFSVEEIWVPWMAGATLVPKPAGSTLLGWDLHDFLTERHVTALCCVPTLLATLEEDLPELRFLLVSGEACPQDLIARWHKPGRRFLNVYGPTEATVTATWTTLDPNRPVTIGQPLPTYSTVILDRDDPHHALPHGSVGEIGIAGIGLAAGYLNRDDLTQKAFIPDFLGIPGNPSGRIYRTGDLGRVNAAGEIEYMGRIDLQVKIRGYRIELTEIESVLLQVPGVAAAVVDTFEPTPGATELVAYYSLRSDTTVLDPEEITAHLEERLPTYMVPAYLEQLAAIPMTPQDKVDRRALPAPTERRAASGGAEHVAPASETEQILAGALARTLGVDQVSVEDDFFDDLGTNSLLMAQFSARVRKETALPSLSMREIYQHSTVRELAAAVGGPIPAADRSAETGTVVRTSNVGYLVTGALQLLTFLVVTFVGSVVVDRVFTWASDGTDLLQVFTRSAAAAAVVFLATALLPIVAKWVLVGRFTEREIRLWSPGYFRFWLVKTLIQVNPMALFAGSPVYNLYLRALGAKIGRGATILSRSVPVATDLISIGADSIIRRNVLFSGYHAVGGVLRTGRITLGRDVFVGETSVLDIGTTMGDGAQLGNASSMHEGQVVPAGEAWHGVPAEPATTNYRVVAPAPRGTLRRFVFGTAEILGSLVLLSALSGVVITLLTAVPQVENFFEPPVAALAAPSYYLSLVALSAVVFFGGLIVWLAVMFVVPRLLTPMLRPGRTYRLYGFHHVVASLITLLSNSPFFMTLFGDSSAVVGYARGLGYDLSKTEQTGSNFGTELQQDSPLLTRIGTGTMVSDGLSVLNTDYSSSSFRVSRIAIGERNFLGNGIVYPADAKLGANVLLATKVLVPIDGPVREDVGLLGSPAFEIPRSVARDSQFDELKSPEVLRRRLRAKLRYNLASMATFLLVRWVQLVALVIFLAVSSEFYARFGAVATVVGILADLVFGTLLGVFAERAVMGFRKLSPKFVSIYDPYFWRHERLWKHNMMFGMAGTPFRTVLWRLLGVQVGKRLFDDGGSIPDKTLVTIGDDVVLNSSSVIQCHSLEDGTFKSDRTVIGSGAAIGVSAFVHYGVTMGEGTVLAADSFLMKGEETAPFTRWGGNPATELRPVVPALTVAPPAVPADALEQALAA